MAPVEIKYTQLFINNEFVDAVSGKKFPTYNPATEEVIAHVAEADAADVDIAVVAARKAFELGSEYRSLDASARGALMMKFAALLRRDIEYLAKLETLNNGKAHRDAVADVNYSAACIEYYAGWCDKITGKTIPADGPVFTYTRREPIGVCGQIIPWNYPIMMIAWKFGPALACGNTIVLKPAEQTPLTALYIGALIKEAGFPAGVVNVVPGYGATAGAAISNHHGIDKIAFTGSTDVGHLVQQASGKSNLKRVSLELGGKSPFIIFNVSDEDLEAAAGFAAASIFGNQGQSCCASSRVFVHESVYERYLEKAAKIAASLVVGDPYDENTTQGAIISDEQFKKILAYVESGKKQGARLVEGGVRVGTRGYFIRPTVFGDVTDDMKIAKEEIFGPVMSVIKFSSVQEVIKRANATHYGLAAGVFCNDVDTVLTLVNALQAGSVWVNCYEYITAQTPFGGYKQSGFGRELGEDGLHEYSEIKTVTIKFNTKA